MWLLPRGLDFLTRFRRANCWLERTRLWLLARCGNLCRRANCWLRLRTWGGSLRRRANCWLRLRTWGGSLRRRANYWLRLRTWCGSLRWRIRAAIVSVQAAPVGGVKVRAKRAHGPQGDGQGQAIEVGKFHRRPVISCCRCWVRPCAFQFLTRPWAAQRQNRNRRCGRSEEHTSELQSRQYL